MALSSRGEKQRGVSRDRRGEAEDRQGGGEDRVSVKVRVSGAFSVEEGVRASSCAEGPVAMPVCRY